MEDFADDTCVQAGSMFSLGAVTSDCIHNTHTTHPQSLAVKTHVCTWGLLRHMILFFPFMCRRAECVGMGSVLQGSGRHMRSIGVSPQWKSLIYNS